MVRMAHAFVEGHRLEVLRQPFTDDDTIVLLGRESAVIVERELKGRVAAALVVAA